MGFLLVGTDVVIAFATVCSFSYQATWNLFQRPWKNSSWAFCNYIFPSVSLDLLVSLYVNRGCKNFENTSFENTTSFALFYKFFKTKDFFAFYKKEYFLKIFL